MTTEIKFECITCQQRILVHAEAAGMHTDCPTCGSSVTVPQTGALNDRHYAGTKRSREKRRAAGTSRDALTPREGGEAFDLPELMSLRQDLMEASVETTRLERELSDARAEAAKLRQLHDAASAEAEKLHANARHTQAELKTFQTERLALKTDLSNLRQKLGIAEERFDTTQLELLDAQARLGEQETELEQSQRLAEALRAEIESLRTERAQLLEESARLTADLNTSGRLAASLDGALQSLQVEFEAAKELLNEAQANRTNALREMATLADERAATLRQLDDARAQLAILAQTQARLNDADAELARTRQQLAGAEENARKANQEIVELRRTMSEQTEGRDFIESRAKLEMAQVEQARLIEEARQLRESLASQESAARSAEDRLKQTRQQLAEALRVAEAASEARLRRDNDVLRGIIARQNSDLEQKHVQLVRLKRARLALRIIYSIFGLGLIAIGLCAVKFVPGLGF